MDRLDHVRGEGEWGDLYSEVQVEYVWTCPCLEGEGAGGSLYNRNPVLRGFMYGEVQCIIDNGNG